MEQDAASWQLERSVMEERNPELEAACEALRRESLAAKVRGGLDPGAQLEVDPPGLSKAADPLRAAPPPFLPPFLRHYHA